MECFFTRIRELKWVGNRPTFKRICKRYPVHAFAVSEKTQIWEVMLIQETLINVLLLDRIAFWRTTNQLALGAPAILAHKEDNSASVATPQRRRRWARWSLPLAQHRLHCLDFLGLTLLALVVGTNSSLRVTIINSRYEECQIHASASMLP